MVNKNFIFIFIFLISLVFVSSSYCTFCNLETSGSSCVQGYASSVCNPPLPDEFIGWSQAAGSDSSCFCNFNEETGCSEVEFREDACSFTSRDYISASGTLGGSGLRFSKQHHIKGMILNPGYCRQCVGREVNSYIYSKEFWHDGPYVDEDFIIGHVRVCECDPYEACYSCDETGCYNCRVRGSINPLDDSSYGYFWDISLNEFRTDENGNEAFYDIDILANDYYSACNPEKGCPIYNDCPGDINNDMQINQKDLAIFFENWLRDDCSPENSCCNGADINGDGVVDMQDYSIIAENFGARCLD